MAEKDPEWRSALRTWAAQLIGIGAAALMMFVIYFWWESTRTTWVHVERPRILQTHFLAEHPQEIEIRVNGYMQRSPAYVQWSYILVDGDGEAVYEESYAYGAVLKGQVLNTTVSRGVTDIEAGEYELVIVERTQLFSFIPFWWSHEQARFHIKFFNPADD